MDKKQITLILLGICGLMVVGAIGVYVFNSTAQRIIIDQSNQTSINWANHIGSEIGRIEEIANGADINETEQTFLNGVQRLGNIFRFKIFDIKGRTRLVSDDLQSNLAIRPDLEENSWKALLVANSGKPYSELGDGTKKADRPDLYAETYVPVFRNGKMVAIAEIYMNLSDEFKSVKLDFWYFGLKIIAVTLLLLSIPGYATLYMVKQLRRQNENLNIERNRARQAESAVQIALNEAEQANRVKSDFLATLSHEFRTPLNAILGFSEMLRAQYFGPLGAENYKEYANDIHNSGQHMLTLVDDVLDISAIEAGKRNISKEMIVTEDLLSDCMRNIKNIADRGGIHLSLEVSDNSPPLYADKRSATQVVFNLLSNAVKFTNKDGNILLSAMLVNSHTVIAVKDTGIGIPADKLTVVTDLFAQADSNPHNAQEGTGLGLAIVKSLIEAHDGELNIKSEIGKGTTVTVTFPPCGTDIK